MALTNSRSLEDPYPKPTAPLLSLVNETRNEQIAPGVSMEDGALKIEHEDGSVTIDLNPDLSEAPDETGFDANLAKQLSSDELGSVSSSLLEGIRRDEESRHDWLETRALGITLLGLKIEKPRSDAGTSSAPIEGVSTVRHPLLLEATVAFQATARAELLPSAGPVKVRNDAPMPPKEELQNQMINPLVADTMEKKDDLSQALEKDMNHYLTHIATEYVPDTDRMLFYVGFGGDGFKKVYNCPLRRRPVSESVDAENLIVSNGATDLHNCGRVTHLIKMRPSILRRMQILGVYRDIDLNPPGIANQTVVDKRKEEIQGFRSAFQRPEDRDYEIYECYCELDLDEFAPKDFKGKGLPLPYRVTIEKESRQILDIRRNWKEDDKECLAKRYFVQFPFIRGLGFYGLGYIHLLGNTTNALTGAWREMLDAGMFANFPGFLYSKGFGRQVSNQFRVPPGGGVGLDIGATQNIRDAVMPLPYKEPGASFTGFITHVEEIGQRLASTANIKVGEGKQDAPVGTTLALIEQASKITDSSHKRLHASQAEELKLLKERFKEDPESFWRHNKRPAMEWQKDQFLAALEQNELVPVADPNNPTSLHRIAKAMAIKTLQQASPDLYDPVGVDMRIMRIVDIDPTGLFRAAPAPPPPDPRMEAIQQKAKSQEQTNQIQLLETQIKAHMQEMQMLDKEKDRASREKIEALKLAVQNKKIEMEQIIHANDDMRDRAKLAHEMQMKGQEKAMDIQHENISRAHDLQRERIAALHEMEGGRIADEHQRIRDQQRHEAQMQRDAEEHDMKMMHARELHEAKLEAAKQLAKVKPKKAKES